MFRKPTAPPKPGLQMSVTDAAPCQKSLRLEVPTDAIAPVRGAVLAEFQKRVMLPGFRKGKAPAELVGRQYADDIREETLQRVTQQAIEQAIQEYALKPVGPVEVRTSNFSDADGLTLEATVEIEPSFTLGAYTGIALSAQPVEVKAQDMERALAELQESAAQLVPAAEGEAKERRVPPLDDEFAKDLGYGRLDELRTHVEAKLRERRRAARAQALEAALCEELLKRHSFEVPPRLVAHQTERLTREFKVRLLLSGMPEPQLEEEVGKFTGELRTSAARHVKLVFILDRIAAKESVSVTQDELVRRLWELAQRWKKDPAEVRRILDAQGLWPSVVSAIRQEKTMAFLIAAASIDNRVSKGGPT
jgi:FKBP-type peptidyl-prolyl cis-trans isomerase (trigger factor)